MARPLRRSQIRFSSDCPVDGLAVVGQSNARGLDIPHLPQLVPVDGGKARHPGVLTLRGDGHAAEVSCPELFDAFSQGDVVSMDSRRGLVRTVLAARANANTLLVTEQCDNRCLFCSQPPNDRPDALLYANAAIALLNFNTPGYVGITGGEPTINRPAFLSILRTLNHFKIPTVLHVLTNGRAFSDREFVEDLAPLLPGRPILWGVPLYGHKASLHDELVAAQGAFTETAIGLSNLLALGQTVELRIVPTQTNVQVLPHIIEFVTTHLSKIELFSIMQLEPIGWGRRNFDHLFVPVSDQNPYLASAVEIGTRAGASVRLFNYPLCLLTRELRDFAVKSISDWKNYYPPDCDGCRLRDTCGGFFSSAIGRFLEPVEALQ